MKKIIGIFICFVVALCPLYVVNSQDYAGTPYGGTAPVATTSSVLKIQIEDFDEGGKNVAYYSTKTKKATKYRTNEYVAITSFSDVLGVTFSTDEWLNFTVNSEIEGMFHLKLNALSYNSATCINVYVNEVLQLEERSLNIISQSGQFTPSLNNMGIIKLNKGTNVIKIKNTGMVFYPDYFTLEYNACDFIYVDGESGDDYGAGTKENPLKTVIEAKNRVRKFKNFIDSDFYVYIKSGTYYIEDTLVFDENDSGINGYNIVYDVYGGDKVCFSGAEFIDGWIYDSNKKMYKAPLTEKIPNRQLYINSIRAVRARSEGGLTNISVDDDTYGFTADETFLADYKNPSDLEFVYSCAWINNRCGAESIALENNKAKIKMKQPTWRAMVSYYNSIKAVLPYKLMVPDYYENALELLDKKREFYIDNTDKFIYYIPEEFEDMNTVEAVVPTTQQLVLVKPTSSDKKVENIKFKNISFEYTAWLYPEEKGGVAVNQDNMLQYYELNDNNMPSGAVQLENANNVTFENCVFSHLGSTGLAFFKGTENCVVKGSEFYDISGIALCVGDSLYHLGHNLPENEDDIIENIFIDNNYFHDVSVEYNSGAVISLGFPRNVTISNNEIFNTSYSAIHIGSGWKAIEESVIENIVVKNNYFHEIMTGNLYDGGAVYTMGPSKRGGTLNYVKDNYIKNQYNTAGALYNDDGSFNWVMENNVVDLSEVDTWSDHNIAVQKPKWMLTNKALYGKNRYKNNYTTTGNCMIRSNITVSGTKVFKDLSAVPKARKIINNAGLSSDYLYLADEVQSFKLDKNTIDITTGETISIKVIEALKSKDIKVSPSDLVFCFSSDDSNIACVNQNGEVTGVSSGNTEISVILISDGVIKEKTVTVSVN